MLIFILLLLFPSLCVSANVIINSCVIDEFEWTPLVGATVKYNNNIIMTDLDGRFQINIDTVATDIEISYVGYEDTKINIVKDSTIDFIRLRPKSIKLKEVEFISQTANEQHSPLSITTIRSTYIDDILGSKEFPEVLNNTTSVHVNKQGGGWGDAEVWMRGYDNSNIAILINGIPVNDPENGSLFWSNWEDLSDVTEHIQVQKGIGASKISTPSIGGTVNIVTKSTKPKLGGSAYYMLGNDGYNKFLLNFNSGEIGKGWYLSMLFSKTWGNGYVQGTNFDGYCYYAEISKKINNSHLIKVTLFGAPQKHYMRSYALTRSEWNKVENLYDNHNHWTRYNPDFGTNFSGQRKSTDYNEYHKPVLSINYIWDININSSLTANIYGSWGRGYGNSGRTHGDTYTEDDWCPTIDGHLNMKFRCIDGTYDYNAIYKINMESTDGSKMVMTKQLGNNDTYGIIMSYNHNLINCLDLNAGIDFRYYKSTHTNEISDLYGGEYFIDDSRNDVLLENKYLAEKENWINQKLQVGDIVYRDYDSYIMQEGVFISLDYKSDKFNAVLSGSFNINNYWRYDRLYYDEFHARSKTSNFFGGNIKAGVSYNINKANCIYVNGGYLSKAPQFKSGVFMSANTSNAINSDARNEQSVLAEIGYRLQHKYCNINLNGYYSKWIDKSMIKKGTLSNGERYYINMTGVGSRHIGVEFDMIIKPLRWLNIYAMASIGDWIWSKNGVKGYVYNVNGQAVDKDGDITTPGSSEHAKAMIDMNGVHVGGSAQITASLGLTFIPINDLRIGCDYKLYEKNYAYYSLSGSQLSLGKELKVSEPWRIPYSGYLNLHASYSVKIKNAVKISIMGQVNNVIGSYYIEKAWNPSNVDTTIKDVNPDEVYMFFSQGRTWCIRVKVEF